MVVGNGFWGVGGWGVGGLGWGVLRFVWVGGGGCRRDDERTPLLRATAVNMDLLPLSIPVT